MNEIQWYYARDDQRFGPLSTADIKRLADRGKLTPHDLVWREGMTDWTEAEQIKGLFQPAPPQPPPAASPEVQQPPGAAISPAQPDHPRVPRPARHLVEVVIALARRNTSETFVESSTALFALLGHYAMYAAMLLVLAAGVAVTAHESAADSILLAVVAIPALAVLQFAARRFCEALDRLNRSTRAEIASTLLLDLLGTVSMVLGIVLLLAVAGWAIASGEYLWILTALLAFILCQHLATVCFVRVDENVIVSEELSPGEEALGTLFALLKAAARLVPVAFGAGVCVQTVALLVAAVQCLQGGDAMASGKLALPLETGTLALYAALPLLGYLLFLLFALIFDVLDGLLTLRQPHEDQ
ncbi:MAG: DUF4339 domain-containing protein [Pirellulales bacterium]|nr:DUF4339 domain-containing protein [Pirellulales bacterium]